MNDNEYFDNLLFSIKESNFAAELVGKCFCRTCADEHTCTPVSNSAEGESTQEELWCYCKQPESGPIIWCDGN